MGMQTITYKSHKIEILPIEGGFYCRWPDGSTYITPTMEAALFLAEQMLDAPELYEQPERGEWNYLFSR
jgi:hypothetical protein